MFLGAFSLWLRGHGQWSRWTNSQWLCTLGYSCKTRRMNREAWHKHAQREAMSDLNCTCMVKVRDSSSQTPLCKLPGGMATQIDNSEHFWKRLFLANLAFCFSLNSTYHTIINFCTLKQWTLSQKGLHLALHYPFLKTFDFKPHSCWTLSFAWKNTHLIVAVLSEIVTCVHKFRIYSRYICANGIPQP